MLKKKLMLLTLIIYIGGFFITFFSPQEVKAATPAYEPYRDLITSFPEMRDRCYDRDGADPEAPGYLDINAVSGTIDFDVTGLEDPEDFKDNVIKNIDIFLFKPGDYWGQGEGEFYCKDHLGRNGGFRFDNVYPGTYQLIVYDKEKGTIDTFKSAICNAIGGIGSMWGGFLGALVGNSTCNAILEPQELAFMGAMTVNKVVDTNLIVADPSLKVRVVERASWSGIFMDILTMFDGFLVGLANGVAKQINGGLIIIENLTQNENVVSAWGKVRDASNALLIIGLLIIALANVFRFQIDVYTARALLPRLLIAGVMINFSLLLTQLIIDVSNVLTLFLGEEIYFHTILPLNSAGFNMLSAIGIGVGGFLFFLFWGFILLIAAIAAFTVLAILVVRIALLWVLAIFSPLIFLFGVLPFTRGLNSMWWKYLIQYAFMGPVMALLLLVASKL